MWSPCSSFISIIQWEDIIFIAEHEGNVFISYDTPVFDKK